MVTGAFLTLRRDGVAERPRGRGACASSGVEEVEGPGDGGDREISAIEDL